MRNVIAGILFGFLTHCQHTTLATVATPQSAHLVHNSFKGTSGVTSLWRCRFEKRCDCDIIPCATHCDYNVQVPSNSAGVLGRRHFGLGLGKVGAALVSPVPALAANDFLSGPDGIEYIDLKVGKGDTPTEGDELSANYIVFTLPSKIVDTGKAFPISVGTGQVIEGWDIAILGGGNMPPMRVGGKRKVTIPSELAYGKRGLCVGSSTTRCLIPPDTALGISIEIVSITKKGQGKLPVQNSMQISTPYTHIRIVTIISLVAGCVGTALASSLFLFDSSVSLAPEDPLLLS